MTRAKCWRCGGVLTAAGVVCGECGAEPRVPPSAWEKRAGRQTAIAVTVAFVVVAFVLLSVYLQR